MIRLHDIKLPLDGTQQDLLAKAATILRLEPKQIQNIILVKRSLDARKKSDLHFIYTIDVVVGNKEKQILAKTRSPKIQKTPCYHYEPPKAVKKPLQRPVIVGSGPAGLFATLVLAQAGLEPILLERGKDVTARQKDVEYFWRTGHLNPESNVQFGEGGAGTFSDGKLTTGTKDPRIRQVLQEMVACGAPADILYLAKPHIGTDQLRTFVATFRQKLISLGAEVRFQHCLSDLFFEQGVLQEIAVVTPTTTYRLPTHQLILAIGHSARDTFRLLEAKGVPLAPKSFSLGARIEHSQSWLDRQQYGDFVGHPALGAADYKLACHFANGRSAYTFCMCPGGFVVAAASQPQAITTNGMSYYSRNGSNANSALLVGVNPIDFPSQGPLSGMYWQETIEKAAFQAGGGNYHAPAQRVEDFLANRPSKAFGQVQPTYQPGVTPGALQDFLPPFIIQTMQAAIVELENRLPGFATPDALLTGPETRSSSPIRILRGSDGQSPLCRGLFPAGEGAGYAGGIISAATDGMRAAEALIASLS